MIWWWWWWWWWKCCTTSTSSGGEFFWAAEEENKSTISFREFKKTTPFSHDACASYAVSRQILVEEQLRTRGRSAAAGVGTGAQPTLCCLRTKRRRTSARTIRAQRIPTRTRRNIRGGKHCQPGVNPVSARRLAAARKSKQLQHRNSELAAAASTISNVPPAANTLVGQPRWHTMG